MPTRVRKQIYIDPDQEAKLKQLAAESGRPEAAIIREALDRCTARPASHRRDRSAWARISAAMDESVAQGPISGGRSWTREDAYDRAILRRH